MSFRKDAEAPEECGPNKYEEQQHKENNVPFLRMLAGPQVEPIAAVWGRQEIVLNEDGVEKPLETVNTKRTATYSIRTSLTTTIFLRINVR